MNEVPQPQKTDEQTNQSPPKLLNIVYSKARIIKLDLVQNRGWFFNHYTFTTNCYGLTIIVISNFILNLVRPRLSKSCIQVCIQYTIHTITIMLLSPNWTLRSFRKDLDYIPLFADGLLYSTMVYWWTATNEASMVGHILTDYYIVPWFTGGLLCSTMVTDGLIYIYSNMVSWYM